MESIQHITTDYVLFIKNFLINFGYTKYCKLVYERDDHEIEDYTPLKNSIRPADEFSSKLPVTISNDAPLERPILNLHGYKKYLVDTLDDIEIWDKLFDELYYPFKYFYTIMSDEEIIKNANYHDFILGKHTSNTYKCVTFQEYIDSKITLKRVGPADYTNFIKNMTKESFRNNLISQYETEMYKRTIKNHLIYSIQLQVKYMTYNIEYLTENEIIQYIDIIPYFEYLGKNNWSQETIMNNIDYTFEKNTDKQLEFLELEQTALAMISSKLL